MEGYASLHGFLPGLWGSQWENIDTFMKGIIIINFISEISSSQIPIWFQNGSHLKWKPVLFKES